MSKKTLIGAGYAAGLLTGIAGTYAVVSKSISCVSTAAILVPGSSGNGVYSELYEVAWDWSWLWSWFRMPQFLVNLWQWRLAPIHWLLNLLHIHLEIHWPWEVQKPHLINLPSWWPFPMNLPYGIVITWWVFSLLLIAGALTLLIPILRQYWHWYWKARLISLFKRIGFYFWNWLPYRWRKAIKARFRPDPIAETAYPAARYDIDRYSNDAPTQPAMVLHSKASNTAIDSSRDLSCRHSTSYHSDPAPTYAARYPRDNVTVISHAAGGVYGCNHKWVTVCEHCGARA